jgi:ELWxxDGT repeat protein
VSFADQLYFVAADPDSYNELWRSDGTDAGTLRVKDIHPGPSAGVESEQLVVHKGTLYFGGDDGKHGLELWRSDGTAQGTRLVKDFCPGACSGFRDLPTSTDSWLLFRGFNGAREGLSRSDGTAAGTRFVKEICFPCSNEVPGVLALGSTVYFPSEEPGGPANVELWKSDGTKAGTAQIMDLNMDPALGSHPAGFAALGTVVLFAAQSSLWRTDGTEAGTVAIKAFNSVGPIASAGDRVYFAADDGASGTGLWRSDGTEAGTYFVKGIIPAVPAVPGSSSFALAGDVAYFTADDGISGIELWRTDGTAAGTMLVADINPGPNSSYPGPLAVIGSRLYFVADDGAHGSEPWALDLDVPMAPLLRNTAATAIDPVTPPLAGILPLTTAKDSYIDAAVSGMIDPEQALLGDSTRPLVFYALDAPLTLTSAKTATGSILLRF